MELCRQVDHILWTFVDKEARTCGHWHYYYTAIGDFLVIFNSSVNFVIYIVTSRNFRQGLMLMQAASFVPTRTGQLMELTTRCNRQNAAAGDDVPPPRTDNTALRLPNAGLGSTATSVVLRTAALTPVAELPPPLIVKHTATTSPVLYFEPNVLLE